MNGTSGEGQDGMSVSSHHQAFAVGPKGRPWGRLIRMQRRLFTWRMNAYRLIVGAIVLAIVIPAWAVGVQAMWLVAFACTFVVVCAVIAGTRVSSIREWLRR
jgi:hypothetical protein